MSQVKVLYQFDMKELLESRICITNLQKQLNVQNDQILDLMSERERVSGQTQMHEKELTNALSLQQQEFEIQMDYQKHMIDLKDEEINRLNGLILELKSAFDTKTAEIESIMNHSTMAICSDLGSKLSWFEGMEKTIKSWKSFYRKQLKAKKNELVEAARKTEKMESENNDLNMKIQEEKEATNAIISSSKNELSAKEEELDVLKDNFKFMENDNQRLLAENDEFKAQIAISIGIKNKIACEMEETLKLVKSMEADSLQKESVIHQLKLELQESEALAIDLTEKVQQVDYLETVSFYNATVQQLKAKNELLEEFYIDREARMSEELNNTRSIAKKLEISLATYMTNATLLDGEKDILENQMANLRTAHESAIRELSDHKRRIGLYEEEIANILASSPVSSVLDSKSNHYDQGPSIATQTPHNYMLDIHTQTESFHDFSISNRTKRNKTEKVSFQTERIPCSHCDKTYIDHTRLMRHMKEKHSDVLEEKHEIVTPDENAETLNQENQVLSGISDFAEKPSDKRKESALSVESVAPKKR